MMKWLLICSCCILKFAAIAQQNTSLDYIKETFSKCETVNIYLYKADTLVKCENKKVERPRHADMMSYIVYYNTKKEIKFEARIGGFAGFRKSAEFLQMEKALILIATLQNETKDNAKTAQPREEVSKKAVEQLDTVKNKVFDPKGNLIFFYNQANFKGTPLIINTEGKFYLTLARPIWDNAISSMQIPIGYFVTLYDTVPYAGGELATYVELNSNKKKPILVKDCKKLPAYYFVTATTPNYSSNKLKIVNFDKKISYIVIAKM